MKSNNGKLYGSNDSQDKMELLPNYYVWIYNKVSFFLKRRIADLGCGKGFMLRLLSEQGNNEILIGLDGSETNIANNIAKDLKKVVLLHRDMQNYDYAELAKKKIDTIIFLDVLEHIQNDEEILLKFYEVLPAAGRLIIKVPAVKLLYGTVDKTSGHYRRYSKKELEEKTRKAGFNVLKLEYMNIFGVCPYFIKNNILKRTSTFSRTYSDRSLRIMNYLIVYLQFLDRFNPFPIGLSLIGSFEK